MKKVFNIFLLLSICFMSAISQEKTDRDTIYNIPPVVVSSTRAVARISPVTFSDLNRTQIQQRYSVQDVPSLLSDMPSITFYSENGNGIGYNYINLRGFDQRRLSVLVNGVPQNDPEDHNVYWIDFPDLMGSTENIQVQRGAGSAFYGPPAIGGSVNLIAVPFRPDPQILLESLIGLQEYNLTGKLVLSTQKYSATFNSGLVQGNYMFYGRLGKITTEGYRDKAWVDANSYFFGAARLDENMTTRIHFYGGPFTDGEVYYGVPKFFNNDLRLRRMNLDDQNQDPAMVSYSPLMQTIISRDRKDTIYVVPRRPQEAEQFSQPHFELLHEWRLSPKVTLFNTLFYVEGDGYYDYDGTWADDTTMLRLGSAYGIPTTMNPKNTLIRAFVGNKQVGWLPRLELEHKGGTITLGAEVRIHRSLHWGKISYAENLPSGYDPDYHFYEYNGKKDIISVYGHEMLKPRENMTLMADIQLAYNRYAIANEKYLGNNFSFPYFFVNPRIGVNYNLNKELNVYSTLAYTSREPRLKNLYSAEEAFYGATPQFEADTSGGVIRYDFHRPLAKPEHLYDFEIGAAFRNNQSLLSINLFWMEFEDELISSGQVDIFGEPVTGNADRTRHIGIELEGSTKFTSGFSISGNATVSHNRLIRYSVVDSAVNGIIYRHNLDGNPIAGAPDYMANIRISQSWENLSISAEGKYVGSFYTDNTKNEALKNDEYFVVNAGTLYKISMGSNVFVTLRAEVHNLFNALYTMSGEGSQFFPAAERNYILGISLQL